MALSSAEKARLWRQRHPEAAAAHLATLKGKPRKKRAKIVTPSVVPVDTRSGEADAGDSLPQAIIGQGSDTLLDTMTADHEDKKPQAAADAAHTVIAGCIREMQDIRAELRVPLLALPELTRLRLRLDACARIVRSCPARC
jgi:hypothetical protein